jgi:hypothetical protein
VPEEDERRRKAREAIEGIKALRPQFRNVTLDELLAGRHEGHKY